MLRFVWVFLAGCAVSESWYDDNVRDIDGDGLFAERFGGPDCDDTDPSIGDCDRDGDGFRSRAVGGDDCDDDDAAVNVEAAERCNGIDDDCDGAIDDADVDVVDASPAFLDLDEDGFGAGAPTPVCGAPPPGYAAVSTDCDDERADIHPGAAEYCDDTDRDCDGETHDTDALDAVAERWVDADADGWAVQSALGPGCVLEGMLDAAAAPAAPDCDDADPDVHPGAPQIWYDGIDQTCGGVADDDQDGDGSPLGVDCDDTDPLVAPGMPERCNNTDDDCDGLVDDADVGDVLDPDFRYLRDVDADGYGNPDEERWFCTEASVPAGYVRATLGLDCNDLVDVVHPGADELCDGLDNDCDESVDENPVDAGSFYLDGDGDGFGATVVLSCAPAPGVVSLPGDCDDTDAHAFPGAPEVCGDGVLQDCTAPDRVTDCDRDGSVDVLFGGNDCDDANPARFPGNDELCDGLDNDCDGAVDDDAEDALLLYRDLDGDGFGSIEVATCSAPGFVEVGGDCDDQRPTTYPGAPEVCGDGVLQDCDAPTRLRDCDGDGFDDASLDPPGLDCDDARVAVNPVASEICDGLDNDCDGDIDDEDDDVDITTVRDWFQDEDGDGFGSDVVVAEATCSGPVGGAPNADDCDDTRADVNPDLPERCDGIDNDCDLAVDEGIPVDVPTYHLDRDEDGFGSPDVVSAVSCEAPTVGSWLLDGSDCDDFRATVFPGAVEVCDARDNDCDGAVDDADTSGLSDFTAWYVDSDNDGVGQQNVALIQCATPAGYATTGGDCDDTDPDVLADRTWFADADGDGYGDAGQGLDSCGQPAGYVLNAGDCDDTQPQISPASPETCDGADNDCDGLVDDEDALVSGATRWYHDLDRDFWGAGLAAVACTQPENTSPFPGDCEDGNADVNPSAIEVCDGIDNDCNQLADDDELIAVVGEQAFYDDDDLDGYGGDRVPGFWCDQPGKVTNSTDCDDHRDDVHPFATEVCDGVDNNCSGLVDAEDTSVVDAVYLAYDGDGDGFGTEGSVARVCGQPPHYVFDIGDCDDGDAAVFPGAHEVCDGIDNDCANGPDDGVTTTYWEDNDGDGFGWNGGASIEACEPSFPYTSETSTDCDDGDVAVHPNAHEVCDGIDNNCAAGVDEGLLEVYYIDSDEDGYGGLPSRSACGPEAPYTASASGDCDDSRPTTYPGAEEVCDQLDNDCDLQTDEGLTTRFYIDIDFDSFGGDSFVDACTQPPGPNWADNGDDCDDGDPMVGAPLTWYPDDDGDGFGDLYDAGTEQCIAPDLDPPARSNNLDCDDQDAGSATADDFFDDADGDGFGDPAIRIRTCDGQPPGFVSDDRDCNPVSPVVPRLNDTWTVGVGQDFETLSDAVDQVCRHSSNTLSFDLTDPLYIEDVALPNTPSYAFVGHGAALTELRGQIVGGQAQFEALTISGAERPLVDVYNGVMTDVVVHGGSGDGPVIRAIDFGGSSSPVSNLQLEFSGGTGIEVQYGLFLYESTVVAPAASDAAVDVVGDFGSQFQVVSSTIGGRFAEVARGSRPVGFSGSVVAVTGSPGQSTGFIVSAMQLGGGTCSSVTYTFSNRPTCATEGSDPGIQSWHPNLPPHRWDFHLSVDSDAYLSDEINVAHGPDYDLTSAGLPQYWEVFHGAACPTGTEDDDLDGLDCLAEYAQGTSPATDDTDEDGVDDLNDPAPLDALTF